MTEELKRPSVDELHRVCKYIAEMSSAMGIQSGVPALEVAGTTVSICSTDRQFAEQFSLHGNTAIIDSERGVYCAVQNGCLSFRAQSGEILTPSEAREKMGGSVQ